MQAMLPEGLPFHQFIIDTLQTQTRLTLDCFPLGVKFTSTDKWQNKFIAYAFCCCFYFHSGSKFTHREMY